MNFKFSSSRVPETPYYTGCPACMPMVEARKIGEEIRPPRRIEPDPDGINWNDQYWGYESWNRRKRRTIVRPLPRNITNRIPPELTDHIIHFLRWERKDLYNCALVCRAWHHWSQTLLYAVLSIEGWRSYNSVTRFTLPGKYSRRYLRFTRVLEIAPGKNKAYLPRSHAQRQYFQTIPCVLPLHGPMPNVQCLHFFYCLYPPYHSSFVMSMARFTELVHFTLIAFKFCSFADLRRIICSLPKLRELELIEGTLSSASASVNVASPPECDYWPRLCSLTLADLDLNLWATLSSWAASTNVCKSLTALHFSSVHIESTRLCSEHILEACGPSLAELSMHSSRGGLTNSLAYCTNLSNVSLNIRVDRIDSWQAVIAALHDTISQFRSTCICYLKLSILLYSEGDLPSPYSDNEFQDINLRPIQETIARPLFDSLKDVVIKVSAGYTTGYPRLTSDVVITAEEMKRRIRLILQPWDKRGILEVECQHDEY
ncbi:hypothetical protein DAEQUDRAFT_181900 [Daedalea quercina L-15889]|uniref:F-box domain-containing protein n=1 Tax=Daedalea quercina L-15889 TaxID=1314783 RepID=A0A165REY5_9APHY|nr:hypothetical protein DAEQUDRAFT_181900 [Daedalea quercina L-15889]